jgi:ribosome modulation factor
MPELNDNLQSFSNHRTQNSSAVVYPAHSLGRMLRADDEGVGALFAHTQKAWERGFAAGLLDDAECPYFAGTDDALEWLSAWIEGERIRLVQLAQLREATGGFGNFGTFACPAKAAIYTD